MLKGIDPLLSGDLLKVLDDMGHGDQLALVDRNFPCYSSGRPVIRLGEVSILRAAQALLSVLPLDSFQPHCLERMEVDNDPARTTDVQDELLAYASAQEGRALEYGIIRRLDFYQRVQGVYAIVHTLDSVPYGCFVLHKGVVFD